MTARSFFPFCIGLSVFLQVFLLPVLGAIADFTNLKKRLMAFFCYVGSAATCLMFFVTDNRYLAGGFLLVVANLCFGASLVLYNAFLNEITTEDRRDNVSSRGYALGYLGGGVLLLANLDPPAECGDAWHRRWTGGAILVPVGRTLVGRLLDRDVPAAAIPGGGNCAAGRPFRALRGLRGAGRLVPRPPPSAEHAALSCGVHAVQRRHPDLHRHGLAVSLAGALCRPRPSRRPVIPDRTGSDDSVRGVLRRAAVRAYRGLHGHQAGHPDLPGHLGFGDHLRLRVAADDRIRRG